MRIGERENETIPRGEYLILNYRHKMQNKKDAMRDAMRFYACMGSGPRPGSASLKLIFNIYIGCVGV